jgi:hypothetical protein
MMDKLAALFKSRRFYVAVSGLVTAVLNPFGFDPVLVDQTIMLMSVWIIGDSLAKTEDKPKPGGPDN